MATADAQDGSEHVTDFLRRIKELGEQRDQEDMERTRKLEEDIMEARRQREARRKERARSLSPEKQSSSVTPRSIRSPRLAERPELPMSSPLSVNKPLQSLNNALEDDPDLALPNAPSTKPANNAEERKPEDLDSKPESPPTLSASIATAPARGPPLAWQQRPNGLRGPRTRPASFLERRAPTRSEAHSPEPPNPEKEPSRADIAHSLASKDPAWFRQTSDRGNGSAAFRRSQNESTAEASLERMPLHGLSDTQSDPTPDESRPQSSTMLTSESPSFVESVHSKASPTEGNSTALSDSFQEGVEDNLSHPSPARSNSYPRTDPEANSEKFGGYRGAEPASPTKGMGGFVQSAMLRRTDSINRRWNVPTGTGPSRQNSSAGSTLGRPGSRDHTTNSPLGMPHLDESNMFKRPDSSERMPRPSSAHSSSADAVKSEADTTNRARSPDRIRSKTQSDPTADPSSSIKTPDQSLQSSPSKRWSPQKSSWLESALSKPDTPKAKPPSSFSQPAWLSDLQKNRQQRQSKDLGVASSSQHDNTKLDLWGQPTTSSAQEKKGDNVSANTAPPPKPKPTQLSDGSPKESSDDQPVREFSNPVQPEESLPKPEHQKSPEADNLVQKRKPETPPKKDFGFTGDRGSSAETSEAVPSNDSIAKPETPPKKDFRSQLKSRSNVTPKSDSGQLEFLNAAGKLKRTETHRYVAPDVFGDNIRRGKAGLTITGGPQPSRRRDEFKESLIEQKQRMKDKVADSDSKPAVPKKPASPIPEALAKRQALGQSSSSANTMNKPSPEKSTGVGGDEVSVSPTKKQSTELTRSVSPPTVSTKLSGRFNPAIASVIARGPPGPSQSVSSSPPKSSAGLATDTASPQSQTLDSASRPLEHMTKGRARGPKRRVPKAYESESSAVQISSSPAVDESLQPSGGSSKPVVRSSSRNVSLNMTQSES